MNTKYIFVTGGVASSLGKGIIAASTEVDPDTAQPVFMRFVEAALIH